MAMVEAHRVYPDYIVGAPEFSITRGYLDQARSRPNLKDRHPCADRPHRVRWQARSERSTICRATAIS